MDNYTTAETAWKLKEKGFPQPEPQKGQIWHGKEGAYQVMAFQGENSFVNESTVYCHRVGSTQVFDMPLNLFKKFVYAPTPADILKELGKDYNLSFFEGLFYCVHDNLMGEAYSHENPAEACALAYMDN